MAGGKFIGWALDFIPSIIKKIKDGRRVNEVTKIDDSVNTNNDKLINNELHKVIDTEDRRNKANS